MELHEGDVVGAEGNNLGPATDGASIPYAAGWETGQYVGVEFSEGPQTLRPPRVAPPYHVILSEKQPVSVVMNPQRK